MRSSHFVTPAQIDTSVGASNALVSSATPVAGAYPDHEPSETYSRTISACGSRGRGVGTRVVRQYAYSAVGTTAAPIARMPAASILRELAAPLQRGGRDLPCARLYRWLACGSIGPQGPRASRSQRDALLLCGALVGCAQRVLADLNDPLPPMVVAQRWSCGTGPRDARVPTLALVWASPTQSHRPAMPLTAQWIDQMPEALVDSVLRWAPPVVNPADRRGNYVVIAHHLCGLLARHRYPGSLIRVRVLDRSSSIRRNAADMCVAIDAVMTGLLRANEMFVARHAPSLDHGILLTGRSRGWVNDQRRGRHA